MSGSYMPTPEPRVHAPELPGDLPWLNTTGHAGHPVSMRGLRGHLVVLDFWTYCCVNCMHVAPVLARVEEALADEPFVVIGVHSGKFDAERDAARVSEAVRRLRVSHPVVVDRDMAVWSAFAVRSWPTLVVVRPDGTIAAVAPGEPDEGALLAFLRAELAAARAKGTLARTRVDLGGSARAPEGTLAYPGKVAIGPGGLLAIADSGHGRVLVADRDGRVRAAIGGMDEPQGMVFRSAEELFVADARAHVVWRVDVPGAAATPIAGTGALGASPLAFAETSARAAALRSPWDLALAGDTLYVAMAGSHQIAVIDLARGTIAALAGAGAESMVDGALVDATFAQPSGLVLAGDHLFLADSETSSVRVLDLAAGQVRTLVGHGLFDFGDRDGDAATARLQHCVGIALGGDGAPVVCDTYNGKLRRVDAQTGAVTTLAAGLSEPGGVAWDAARGAWLVADSNAHRIVVVKDGVLGELRLEGAPAFAPERPARASDAPPPATAVDWFTLALVAEGDVSLGPGEARIAFEIVAPPGKKLAAGAPIAVTLEVSRRNDLLVPHAITLHATAKGAAREVLELAALVHALPDDRVEAEIVARVDAVACDANADAAGAACVPHRAWIRLPVRLARSGAHAVRLVAAD